MKASMSSKTYQGGHIVKEMYRVLWILLNLDAKFFQLRLN